MFLGLKLISVEGDIWRKVRKCMIHQKAKQTGHLFCVYVACLLLELPLKECVTTIKIDEMFV